MGISTCLCKDPPSCKICGGTGLRKFKVSPEDLRKDSGDKWFPRSGKGKMGGGCAGISAAPSEEKSSATFYTPNPSEINRRIKLQRRGQLREARKRGFIK